MAAPSLFFHWVRTGYLFLLRSGRATLALSAMVMLAIGCLIFLSAFAVGVNDAMVKNSVGLYTGYISAVDLPDSLTPEAMQIAGVSRVLKRILFPGVLSSGERWAGITLIGIDPAAEQQTTALHRKIVQGAPLKSDAAQILLSRHLAAQLEVNSGDTILFQDRDADVDLPLKIAGIYATGIAAMDTGIAFCPLNLIAPFSKSWAAAIFIEENRTPEEIVAGYDRRFKNGDQFKTWKETMPDLLQLIQLNYVSMGIVMFLVMGIVAVGITCTFIVFIFKSIREYGIMKAMGVTAAETALLIMAEVLLINLLAGLGGELIGVAVTLLYSKIGIDLSALTSHNQYFAVSGIIYPRLTFFCLIPPPVIALFFGLLAAVWPALVVARKQAADVLRSV